MQKDSQKIFNHFTSPEPPEGLLEKVMQRIREERRRMVIRRRLAIFSLALAVSAGAFIPIFNLFRAELSTSGFLQIFSLLFSDFGIVAAYWQNFLLSLLEVFPVLSSAAILAILFVFLESLKFLAGDIKSLLTPPKLTRLTNA